MDIHHFNTFRKELDKKFFHLNFIINIFYHLFDYILNTSQKIIIANRNVLKLYINNVNFYQ